MGSTGYLLVAGVGLSQCAAGVFTERSGVTYDLRVILAALVLHKSPTSKQKTLSHESVFNGCPIESNIELIKRLTILTTNSFCFIIF